MDTVNESFAPHPSVVVAAPGHPLAKRKRIPMAELARERFVAREKDSDTWHSMRQAFGRWFGKLDIVMEIKSTETIKQSVIAGLGIAFLSAHTVTLERKVGHLVILDVQGLPLMLDWYLVHRARKRLPPVATAFRRFLVTEGAALMEDITHFGVQRGTQRARGPAPRARRKAA
jgi:DNA-binding transcriptional LysR family regulator